MKLFLLIFLNFYEKERFQETEHNMNKENPTFLLRKYLSCMENTKQSLYTN
jgi:hypothetical protein